MIATFEQARDIMTLHKSPEIIDACRELLEAGLRGLNDGVPYWGPDDIPEAFTSGGQGIMGDAVKILMAGKMIAEYHGNHPDAGVFYGRRHSIRKQAKGRKLQLYEITRRGLVETWLRKHGSTTEPLQTELVLA